MTNTMIKKTMMIDFDGVIADSVAAAVEVYNNRCKDRAGFKKLAAHDIDTWEMEEMKCATLEERMEYFEEDEFFEKLHFMKDFEHVITSLYKTDCFDFKVITMGTPQNLTKKMDWLKSRLDTLGVKMEITGLDEYIYRDKSSIDMTGAIFMDDKASNLETSNAKAKIVFGHKKGWNEDFRGMRLLDWQDVAGYFLRW